MEFVKKNVSGKNGTLMSYMDLPLKYCKHLIMGYMYPNTYADKHAFMTLFLTAFLKQVYKC